MQAQKLKKELAEVQAKMDTSSDGPMPPKATPSNRIDGGDLRRETLDFVGEFWYLLVSIGICKCLTSTILAISCRDCNHVESIWV